MFLYKNRNIVVEKYHFLPIFLCIIFSRWYYVNIGWSTSVWLLLRMMVLFQTITLSLNTTMITIIGKTYNFLNIILCDFKSAIFIHAEFILKKLTITWFLQNYIFKSADINWTNYPSVLMHPSSPMLQWP